MNVTTTRSFARLIAIPAVSAASSAVPPRPGRNGERDDHHDRAQHRFSDRRLARYPREARPERPAGLASPPRDPPVRHVQPVNPQLKSFPQ